MSRIETTDLGHYVWRGPTFLGFYRHLDEALIAVEIAALLTDSQIGQAYASAVSKTNLRSAA